MDGDTRHHLDGGKLAFQPPDCDDTMWNEYKYGPHDLTIAEAVKRSVRFDPIMLAYRRHAHWVAVTTCQSESPVGDECTIVWPR